MKKILACGILLALFVAFSLSFCVLRFWSSDADGIAPITCRYNDEDGTLGELHITVSENAARHVRDFFSQIGEAAKSLPFFITDTAAFLSKEVKEVFSLFTEILAVPPKDAIAV